MRPDLLFASRLLPAEDRYCRPIP